MKSFDERQEHIRGKIAIQTLAGTFLLLAGLSFLDSFDLFHPLEYVDLSDLLIIVCTIILNFVSLNLIWRDAYFGFMNATQTKMVFFIFLFLSMILDCLFIYDLTMNDMLIPSVFTLFMVNSIAISLFCKRKDWLR